MESLTSNFELVKLSKKLEKFNRYKTDLSELTAVLAATDREIDALVYELYGLMEDEIRIVEGI